MPLEFPADAVRAVLEERLGFWGLGFRVLEGGGIMGGRYLGNLNSPP